LHEGKPKIEVLFLQTILRGFSKIHFVLSGFALHLASHFGRSVSKHSYGYVSQPIDQTVLPATLQIPDPSCNMRAKAAPTSAPAPGSMFVTPCWK
jgi:hypothetical protein